MSWLTCTAGPDRGVQLELGSHPLTIGRAPDNHIRLSEEKASRYHCQIALVKGKLELEDLNSTNGTVQGKHVLRGQKVLIHTGDRFAIGQDIFEYRRGPDRALINEMKSDDAIPDFKPDRGNEQTKFDSSCGDIKQDRFKWISRLLGK